MLTFECEGTESFVSTLRANMTSANFKYESWVQVVGIVSKEDLYLTEEDVNLLFMVIWA